MSPCLITEAQRLAARHRPLLGDRTVRVLGKGRKTRVVPVGKHALDAIARWLKERATLAATGEQALFVGSRGERLGPRAIQKRIAGWARHQEEERTYLRAEDTRLVYVAATRAKELLVVSRLARASSRGPWQLLALHLGTAPALPIPPIATQPPPAVPDLSEAARTVASQAREAQARTRHAPSWEVESVTGTAHRAGPYGHPLQEGRTREPDTGMAWGSLIHFLLEHAMRGPHRDRAHLERLAGWFAFDTPDLRRVIPEALAKGEPVLLNFVVYEAEKVWPMVPAGAGVDEMIIGDQEPDTETEPEPVTAVPA